MKNVFVYVVLHNVDFETETGSTMLLDAVVRDVDRDDGNVVEISGRQTALDLWTGEWPIRGWPNRRNRIQSYAVSGATDVLLVDDNAHNKNERMLLEAVVYAKSEKNVTLRLTGQMTNYDPERWYSYDLRPLTCGG